MHIITFTHTEGLSGGARQALYQAIAFFQKGIKTTFLCIKDSPLHKELTKNLIPVKILEETWKERALQIENCIQKDEDTVIHSFHSPGLKHLAFHGIFWKMKYPRLICVAHRGVSSHPRNPFPYWSPGIDAFVPNSEHVKKQLQHFLPFGDKVKLIYNALPTERTLHTETKEETRSKLNINKDAFVLLSILNDSPRKGTEDLLTAFSLLKSTNVYLIIIGISGEKDILMSHPKKDFIRVMKTHDIGNFLHCADLFIFPSRSFDSMPNVVLEAMGASLPIIGTDVGGTRELIKNNGFIVPPNNPLSISNKIEHYIKTPYLLKEHAKESALLSENFTVEKRVDKLLALYNKLLEKRKRNR